MPSFIWNRDPQEAMDNPYEYDAQNQFIREADQVLNSFSDELSKFDLTYKREDKSKHKAIWMLHTDALDSLKDILDSLKNKKHRIAGKLFRDIVETLDLAALFHSDSKDCLVLK